MQKRIFGGTLMLILVVQGIFAYELDMNKTSLPYSGSFIQELEGTNSTVQLAYGEFLSGPGEVDIPANVTVLVDIPFETAAQEHISQITAGNETYLVTIAIIDNVIFNLTIEGGNHFIDDVVQIDVAAPEGTDIILDIAGSTYEFTGSSSISYVPTISGELEVTANFSYRGINDTLSSTLIVQPVLSCNIQAPDNALKNTSVAFLAEVTGNIGSISYEWVLEPGITSADEEPSHIYGNSGDYTVLLEITDSQRSAVCEKDIHLSEQEYELVIILKDDISGVFLGDANISINDIIRKTNINGKARFTDLQGGSYKLSVSKEGYHKERFDAVLENDLELNFNMSRILEEEMPVPKIEILYPQKNITTHNNEISFEFIPKSDTAMTECLLLVNFRDHSGYKVKGTISNPKDGREYTIQSTLSNGEYNWRIQCENDDGNGKSQDMIITVDAPVDEVDASVEESVAPINKETVIPDVSVFDDATTKLTDFKTEVLQSRIEVRNAYKILGYDGLITNNMAKIRELRTQMINLAGLEIADIDRARKKSELLTELEELKAHSPMSLVIIDKASYESGLDNNAVTQAISEYLRWKEINLTKRELKKYTELVTEAQEELSVRSTALIAEITYVNGKTADYAIITKDVEYDVSGSIFLELIPEDVAETVDSLIFTVNYELINPKGVVSPSIDETNSFSYYVEKKIDIPSLKEIESVLILDPKHPDNKVTGFAMLSTEAASGKFLFSLLLLSIVLIGNYFIFFRDPDTRKVFRGNIARTVQKLKPIKKDDRLISILDLAIDSLNSGDTDAFDSFDEIISLYNTVSPKLREDLGPVMSHLANELDAYSIGQMIDKTQNELISGLWQNAIEDFNEIHAEFAQLPLQYKKKIEYKYNRLGVSMKIHELKGDVTKHKDMIEDNLFGAQV